MTKEEAISAMKEGKKVTHRYFSASEWMTMDEDGNIVTEENYAHYADTFWNYRQGKEWDDGYEMFEIEEKKIADCSKHAKEVAGISDMKQLAEMIGELNYGTLKTFLYELQAKLNNDGARDAIAGRVKLAMTLFASADGVAIAWKNMIEVCKICEPYMQLKPNQ